MSLETALGISWLIAAPFIGLGLGWLSIRSKLRAERNLRRMLESEPERDAVAQRILRNPNSQNIQQGRDLVVGLLESMSPEDRREIMSALNQDSIRGRAWYVAKLVTDGRSKHFRRIPTDQWVSV